MKDATKNIIAACILAVGLIISTVIYAYSNRYSVEHRDYSKPVRFDKWNGTYQFMKEVK